MTDKTANTPQEIRAQFCEQLKQAGQVLNRPGLAADEINQAESL